MESDKKRYKLTLSPDMERSWPLWDGRFPLASPSDYGLTDDLTARLRKWMDYWDSHYAYRGGYEWNPDSDIDEWIQEGKEIVIELRKQIPNTEIISGFLNYKDMRQF
jgi:hypothetical protein